MAQRSLDDGEATCEQCGDDIDVTIGQLMLCKRCKRRPLRDFSDQELIDELKRRLKIKK